MQNAGIQDYKSENKPFVPEPSYSTNHVPAERVGEDWPPLLTKKWLACFYGCWTGHHVNWNRFRTYVLTPEVLERANIDQTFAYSKNCKTFNAIQSMALTKVLRGFCLLTLLFATTITQAQTRINAPVTYSRDSTLRDTFPGQVLMTDSIVRMVPVGAPGEYRFENVLSSIVVDAFMIKEYRFLIKSSDGSAHPFDMVQRFYYLTGRQIDPNRILLFRERAKK